MNTSRYSPKTVALANRLAKAQWRPAEIRRILHKEHGVKPALTTIRTWTDPDFAEQRRQIQRDHGRRYWAQTRGGRLGRDDQTLEHRTTRMQGLREHGVSYSAIALVMTFDFPAQPMTRDEVRWYLENGTVPKSMRVVAS